MAEGTDENAAEGAETRPKRRRIPVIIVGVLALALGVWGLNRYLFSRHHVSTDNAQLDGHITLIAPRIAAFVTRILVDDNQHVQAGDTLLLGAAQGISAGTAVRVSVPADKPLGTAGGT